MEEGLLLETEQVEPGGDDPLHRLRQRQLLDRAPLAEHAHILLGVERVPARPREEGRLRLRREHGLLQQSEYELSGLRLRERRQRDRGRVRLAATPAGPPREQLRPRARDDEQRNARRPVDEVVDEVEQMLVGPVQVLEDEDERPLRGEILEEPPPSRERLAATVAARLGGAREPDERPQVQHDPGVGHAVVELPLGALGRVGLEDPKLGLDHLAERPERDAVAVRQAPALPPRDDVRVGLDQVVELEHEPALADPGNADERHELHGALLAGARERVREHVELAAPPDERRPADQLHRRP